MAPTNDAFRDEIEGILDQHLPRYVQRERLIIQPASQVTERFDWWPLADRLAACLGQPLLAPGVSRPTPPTRAGRSRIQLGADDQLAMDLGG
jgi:hypothetical protein